jgi:small conductance mechanosensitive channel
MEQIMGAIRGWLDPDLLGPLLISWGGRILAALVVFVLGRLIIAMIASTFRSAAGRAGADTTLTHFLSNLLRITLLVLVALTALGILGVPTTNFLAILGAAGLAVGLALKDSLSNFSSGVMLVFFKPFRVGDFIDAAGISGVVEQISIFNTELRTPDNRAVIVPNSLIYGSSITNFSAKDTRRIDLVIGIGYGDEIHRAKELIQGVLSADERVLEDPAPTIMVLELGASSVDIAVRPWVQSVDYWPVRGELLEKIKQVLEDNGLSIPYPQRDVHIVSQVAAGA